MLLATVTWQYGVSHLESSRAGVILLAELLVSVGTAIAFGGESLSPMGWAGGALITFAALAEALFGTPAEPHHDRDTLPPHRRHRPPHAMNSPHRLDEPALLGRLPAAHPRRTQPPVLLPVGALEQHGPHLPLGTDGLLASAVAADTAARVGGLVAPTLSYGYKSQPKCGGGQHFCGTTSVDAATLIGQIRDAVREFARHGVDKLVVVNGHYENQWFLIEGIDLGLRDAKAADPACALQVMRLEYWDFMTPETLGDVFPDGFPGFALEHAAVLETSMMLHHHPSLVRMDLLPDDGPADFPPYDMYPAAPTGCRPRACCPRPRAPTPPRASCWPTRWRAAWPRPSPPDSPAHDRLQDLDPPHHRADRHRHAARLLQPRRLRRPGRPGHRAHAGRGGPGEGAAGGRARRRPARLPHARRPPARPVGLPARQAGAQRGGRARASAAPGRWAGCWCAANRATTSCPSCARLPANT